MIGVHVRKRHFFLSQVTISKISNRCDKQYCKKLRASIASAIAFYNYFFMYKSCNIFLILKGLERDIIFNMTNNKENIKYIYTR